MINVLVLTRYDQLGASSRVRFLQFLPELKSRGLAFEVRPFLDDDYIRALYGGKPIRVSTILAAYLARLKAVLRHGHFDLIWIEKEVLPWLPSAVELALVRGTPYVVDLDDAWFHRYDRSPWAIVRRLMGSKIDDVMRNAAAVVVGNEYIAERARRAGAVRVEIIPSVVNLQRYPEEPSEPMPVQPDRPIVIGWIGTPITVPYLNKVETVFRSIPTRRSIELRVVGALAPASFAGLPVRSIPWTEADEIAQIRAFDIGIMPLDDTPWEQGKCAYKILQLMAAGRPVVASDVGANRVVVERGVSGLLASTAADWDSALTTLIDDPSLRRQMGFAGRLRVEERYCTDRVLDKLANLLIEATGK